MATRLACFLHLLFLFALASRRSLAASNLPEDDDYADFEPAPESPTELDDGEDEAPNDDEDYSEDGRAMQEDAEDEEVGEEKQESADSKSSIPPGDSDEFDYSDSEEFEGFGEQSRGGDGGKDSKPPVLETAKVPFMSRSFSAYKLEIVMLAAVAVFFINYFSGRSKNAFIANTWFKVHHELLHQNFALVGDDGEVENSKPDSLIKDADHTYLLWCTGRVNCDSMLVELKLLKRQDITLHLTQFMREKRDTINVTVALSEEDMDMFVFAVGQRRAMARLQKEMKDVGYFCPERRNAEKFGLPASLALVSENSEAISTLLSSFVLQTLRRFENCINFIHFSDQYVGSKEENEMNEASSSSSGSGSPVRPKRVLMFSFYFPSARFITESSLEKLVPLMRLVIHMIDRVKKCRLSREAREKAIKSRTRLTELQVKDTHAQRQEQAQERRDEKRRKEKERLMNEEDPVKARKLEEKEHKKALKKKTPKVKTMLLRRG